MNEYIARHLNILAAQMHWAARKHITLNNFMQKPSEWGTEVEVRNKVWGDTCREKVNSWPNQLAQVSNHESTDIKSTLNHGCNKYAFKPQCHSISPYLTLLPGFKGT